MKNLIIFIVIFLITFSVGVIAKEHKLSKWQQHKKTNKIKVPKLLGDEMILPVISIYDGDTIMTSLTLPAPLNAISVRIRGIDTPERPARSYHTTGKLGRAKCVKEAEAALVATAYLEQMQDTHGGAMTVKEFKYGAYAGRIVGDVYIGGLNVAEEMINNGHAVAYDGKSKRNHDWCK